MILTSFPVYHAIFPRIFSLKLLFFRFFGFSSAGVNFHPAVFSRRLWRSLWGTKKSSSYNHIGKYTIGFLYPVPSSRYFEYEQSRTFSVRANISPWWRTRRGRLGRCRRWWKRCTSGDREYGLVCDKRRMLLLSIARGAPSEIRWIRLVRKTFVFYFILFAFEGLMRSRLPMSHKAQWYVFRSLVVHKFS